MIDIQTSTPLPSTETMEGGLSLYTDEWFFSAFIKYGLSFESLQQIYAAIKSWETKSSERTNILKTS